jgi:predicted nucleic acid-binding protein
MLDSNVIISSIFTRNGVAFQALEKASQFPYSLVLCTQILEEVHRFFHFKFPSKVQNMKSTFDFAQYELIFLDKTDYVHVDESIIRNISD